MMMIESETSFFLDEFSQVLLKFQQFNFFFKEATLK